MVSMINVKRQVVTLMFGVTAAAHANPLAKAAETAMRECVAAGAPSIEQCGALTARNAVDQKAQRAAVDFFRALVDANESCALSSVECELASARSAEVGFAAAFVEPQTRSLPRSDMRR